MGRFEACRDLRIELGVLPPPLLGGELVEIERIADALERERPVKIVRREPSVHLGEETSGPKATDGAPPVEGPDGIRSAASCRRFSGRSRAPPRSRSLNGQDSTLSGSTSASSRSAGAQRIAIGPTLLTTVDGGSPSTDGASIPSGGGMLRAERLSSPLTDLEGDSSRRG